MNFPVERKERDELIPYVIWHAVMFPFKTEVYHLNDEETVLVFATPKRDIP